MQHDLGLRAAARAVYEACYPSEEWTPVRFDEAEQHGTVHYRQCVEAARRARFELVADEGVQLPLI